jgi:signal transduction histidine kinase
LLLNLLLNALDALPHGGNVWLDVSDDRRPVRQLSFDDAAITLHRATDGNGKSGGSHCVKLRIADDGPGLSPEVLERVFEPFVSTKDTGIGLGLSICRQIVESHDGRIVAGNRRGGGAEFTVYLPRSGNASPHGNSLAQVGTFDG